MSEKETKKSKKREKKLFHFEPPYFINNITYLNFQLNLQHKIKKICKDKINNFSSQYTTRELQKEENCEGAINVTLFAEVYEKLEALQNG